MLGSYPVVTFVLTTDPDRARKFYEETLGLTFVGQDGHAVIFDLNGTMLRVTIMREFTPAQHTVLGWRVPDIAAAARTLAAAGIKPERYTFLEQDELGVWASPDGQAKVLWFRDPDGNVLSLSQH